MRSRARCTMVLQRPAEARENNVSCQGICRCSRGMAGSKRKTCLKSGAPIVNCPKKDLRCAALVLRRDCSSTDLSSSRAQAMLVLCPVTPGVCMVGGVRTGSELSSLSVCLIVLRIQPLSLLSTACTCTHANFV